MLPKKNRIGDSERIEQVFLKGRRISARFLQFRFLPATGKTMRFAVIMKKKMTKTAVERNTLRRRTYEAIRIQKPPRSAAENLTKPCYDVVVLLSRGAAQAAYKEIENDIIFLLKKLAP